MIAFGLLIVTVVGMFIMVELKKRH